MLDLLGSPDAAGLGPRRTLGALRQEYRQRASAVEAAALSPESPYGPAEWHDLKADLCGRRPAPAQTFRAFAGAASRGRYVPTRPLHQLIPRQPLTEDERAYVFLGVPDAKPGTITKVGVASYAMETDRGGAVFATRAGGTLRAFSAAVVFRVATYAMAWATERGALAPPLATRRLRVPPNFELADALVAELRAGAERAAAAHGGPWAFYAKCLIPAVLSRLPELHDAILCRYGAPDSGAASTIGEEGACAVCLSALDSEVQDLRGFPNCEHKIHAECYEQYQRHGMHYGRPPCPCCKR